MSHVPARMSTTPAHRSWPNAASAAAPNVRTMPTTVTWFGVRGTRPMADIKASARLRTQASNRVVNIRLLSKPHGERRGFARLFVHLDHPRSDRVPCVAASLLVTVGAHPTSQLRVSPQDDQSRAELGPPLGTDRQAVTAGFQDGHVSGHLGGDHREAGGHGLEEPDAKALGAGGRG